MWNRIKQINWVARWKNENAYADAKQFILDSYSKDECEKITEFVNDMHAILSECVRSFEIRKNVTCGKYNGTDSFNDMIAHAVSLGEVFFNDVKANPYILNKMEFGESFLYCLPHNEDFEIRRETKECINELDRIIHETGSNETIANLMQRFGLMLLGHFKEATNDFNPNLYNDMRFFTGNDQSAKFANLIRDCNKFYVSS